MNDPLEMTIEELDLAYGKPQRLATVTAVLGISSNLHHDQITLEMITERGERVEVGFTQRALRRLTLLCQLEADAPDKPKANERQERCREFTPTVSSSAAYRTFIPGAGRGSGARPRYRLTPVMKSKWSVYSRTSRPA